MVNSEQFIKDRALEVLTSLYKVSPADALLQVQKTRKEFEGDYTLVAFPLLKLSSKSPEDTSREIGQMLVEQCPEIVSFNVVKGFLNLTLSNRYWASVLNAISADKEFGYKPQNSTGRTVLVEFSSPNTNKPLHLGHIRNNLLGFSIGRILEKTGNRVVKVNIVNDKGIHICKSMLAWKMFANGKTPESTGIKGDHLVGDYYVQFDREYKRQVEGLRASGLSDEEAKARAPLINEAQELLRKWEAKDSEVYSLWEMMNSWVYEGFDKTYRALGVSFDKIYYESETYILGKSVVIDGIEKGVFTRKPDGSVWIDLIPDGLDEKLLLRSDGTSVYMTQDIGTALERFREFNFSEHIYVVGNEQEYHFQVLKLIMKKLGYSWYDSLYHLSYGMVQLPEGKMKSREGTVVDADDMIEEMISTAHEMSLELGKLDGVDYSEAAEVYRKVGLGALKYFILKVDPKKNMTFNPKESIDFNGNTGPFIQYTHTRICSILRKANEQSLTLVDAVNPDAFTSRKEIDLVLLLSTFPDVLEQAALTHNPALIANYSYEIAKEYNQFYHDFPILREERTEIQHLRLTLSRAIGEVIMKSLWLLGVEVPERM